MKFSKLSNIGTKTVYEIEGVSPAYVNSIRRFGMDYVPTLAIEDVEIVANSSALYDEVVAHRLGLIPLTTDLKSYTLPEGEEISAMNSVQLTLNADNSGYVYAKDLQSKDPKVVPVYDNIQITYLLEGQQFECIATAVMGQGKDHSKWTPANIYYSQKAKIEVNNKSSKLKDVIGKFPSKVVDNGVIVKDAINTPELIDACDGIEEDVVKITKESDAYVLTIDNFGQLESKEILLESVIQFNKQLDQLKELIKEIKN